MSVSPYTSAHWWHRGQWHVTKLQKAQAWFAAHGDCTTVWNLLLEHFAPRNAQESGYGTPPALAAHSPEGKSQP